MAADGRLGRIAARATGLTLSRAVNAVANGLALILLARWTGPGEYGQVAVAMSIQTTVAGVLALGLPGFVVRAAALNRRGAVGYALFLNLATSVGAAALGLALSGLATSVSTVALVGMSVSIALEKNADVRIALGTECGRAKAVNMLLIARSLLVVGVVIAAYRGGLPAVEAYVAARLSGMGLSAVGLWLAVRGWKLGWRRPKDRSLESLPQMAVAASAGSAVLLDVTLVGTVAGAAEAGLYAAVKKLAVPVGLVANSLGVVIMGTAVRSTSRGARMMSRMLLSAALAGLLLCGLLAIWAAPLVRTIFGIDFVGATGAFVWILLGLPVTAITPGVVSILCARGQAGRVARVTVLGTMLQLGLIVVGARYYGSAGAAFAFSIGLWLKLGALAMFVPRQTADADLQPEG